MAHIQSLEPFQKEQPALSFPVERFSVGRPVQFVYSSAVPRTCPPPPRPPPPSNLHLHSLNGDRRQWHPVPPDVHRQLLGLADVQLQVVLVAPSDRALHPSVLLTVVLVDAAHYGGVIGAPLRWHAPELSDGQSVNKNGDSTVPSGAPYKGLITY